MRKISKMAAAFITALLLAAVPFSAAMAEEADGAGSQTYKVTVYPGLQGVFADGAEEHYVEVPYKTRIEVSLDMDGNLGLGGEGYKIDLQNDRYYIRGLKETGHDNDDTKRSYSFEVTEDMSFVATYAIPGDMVKYTVQYLDEEGNPILDAEEFYGTVGEKPIVAARYKEGYLPGNARNLTRTLVSDAVQNVFPFTYYKVVVPEPETEAPTQAPTRQNTNTGTNTNTNTNTNNNTNANQNTNANNNTNNNAGNNAANTGNNTAGTNNANNTAGGNNGNNAAGTNAGNNTADTGSNTAGTGNNNTADTGNGNAADTGATGNGGTADNAGNGQNGEPAEIIDLDSPEVPLAEGPGTTDETGTVPETTEAGSAGHTVSALPFIIGAVIVVAIIVILIVYFNRRKKNGDAI